MIRALLNYSSLILVATFCVHTNALATSTTGFASATIAQSIQLSEVQSMQFGAVSLNGNQGDIVTLSASGNTSSSSASVLSEGVAQNAVFTATGNPNTAVSLSFQNSFLTGAGSSMNINNFTHNAGASPQMNALGALIFHVGADLEINDNQAAGQYSGTYQVTVNYQ